MSLPIERIAERIATRKTRVRPCENCDQPSMPGDRFCSDECATEWQDKTGW